MKYLFLSLILFSALAFTAFAATPCASAKGGYCIRLGSEEAGRPRSIFGFATPVPGLEFLDINTESSIGDVLETIYKFGLGIVGIAAFAMFTVAAVQYMLAGDKNPADARRKMGNAVWGLLLALASWTILYTINPALVKKLELPYLKMIDYKPPPPTAVTTTQFWCSSQENSIHSSQEKCKAECDPLGGTCSAHTVSRSPDATGYCATRSISDICNQTSVDRCQNQNGFYYSGLTSSSLAACRKCAGIANAPGGSVSDCTHPAGPSGPSCNIRTGVCDP